jgi:hypothetical protein
VRLLRTGLHAVAAVALTALPVVVLAPTPAGAATAEFTTVGSSEWIVPDGVSCVTATAVGAEGGVFVANAIDSTAVGGNGGASVAAADAGAAGGSGASTFAVVAGLPLQVDVGGRGGDSFSSGSIPGAAGAGGVNGGGAGGLATIDGASGYFPGAGGGGASDVRVGGTDLEHRVVVGGGGGGGGGFGAASTGVGGGDDGGSALAERDASGGAGGSQSAGGTGGSTDGVGQTGIDGAFGIGGTGGGGDQVNGGGGGGGGGWYGGGGGGGVPRGGGAAAGGGGGSGVGDTLVSGVDAGNDGNGEVTLTYEVGDTSCLDAPLTVKKVATGPTAPGQTFTVHVSCPGGTIAAGDTGLTDVDLAFTVDASGTVQPAAGHTIGFLEQTDCTVTETGTGGATSESYACTGSGAGSGVDAAAGWRGAGAATAADPDDPCRTSGPQATPIGIDIVSEGQVATVTVTNTRPVVAAVAVQPRFTG